MAAGAAALPAVSRVARAQTYPNRPVRIICGFPPGGTTDVLARMIGQRFSERLGQPFIVENRPGAATNIATEAVVRAAADGYTLLMVSPPNVINATLYEKLNFNFLRDIAAVGPIARVANVLEVNPSLPIKSVPDFIAYAKANPGKISFASAGIGSSQHLSGEMFKMMAGIDMVHVPYRGAAPALTDLLGGQVQAMFDNVSSSTHQSGQAARSRCYHRAPVGGAAGPSNNRRLPTWLRSERRQRRWRAEEHPRGNR
jgi:tripartite-type tricarboxylate transporter receptor subunit TctC